MGETTANDGARYWAFISYSHKDAAFGRQLHRRLESYTLPRRLVRRGHTSEDLPRRLAPIFRDRDELPAASDLSTEVRAALQASRSLIVVCSPAAAASRWVSREVELFRTLHPDRPVLAAVIAGEPDESFPEGLRSIGPSGLTIEPLAADFRRGQDGPQLGLLKLVAGIAGIGLDELIRRDSQRRLQRVTAVTLVAVALMLVMSVLAFFAYSARRDAERQRTEAEGLVEFMLTDLRTTLKGVGRLDAMTTVNQRALRYYSDQDLDRLPAESLERRARILHAMGEDDETHGDHDSALAKFREARRTTAALLAEAPNDPGRIFDQAQSEYWIGYVAYQRHRAAEAIPAFESYKRLADRLVLLAPNDPAYRREAGYADGNLCSVALDPPRNPSGAVRSCGAALAQMEEAARHLPPSSGISIDIVNRHAWLADAYLSNGDRARARAERLAEGRLLERQIAADPRNMHLKEMRVAMNRALGILEAQDGHIEAARASLSRASRELDAMIDFDPANNDWVHQRARINLELSELPKPQ